MHAPFLRTDGAMDVIMVRPWMLCSQVGLNSGIIMVGPAMDALRVLAESGLELSQGHLVGLVHEAFGDLLLELRRVFSIFW